MFWLLSAEHLSKSQIQCSGGLEVLDELGSRQDGLGLLECLNLLIAGILAELGVVVGELFQLEECGLLVGDCLLKVLLGLCLLLGLVHLRLGLLLNGGVGVL